MKRIELTLDMTYEADIKTLIDLVSEKSKTNPSETLDVMSKALFNVYVYVNRLQLDRWAASDSLTTYRKQIQELTFENRELQKKNAILESNIEFLQELQE